MTELPLFRRYPEIKKEVPRIPLGIFPTRVHRLRKCGHENLWIKREDESSNLYGGNKIRKLEFTLADAVLRGSKKVVTIGGLGTNHGVAASIFCQKLGMACMVMLFKQPVNRHVRQNLLLMKRFGASLQYCGTVLQTGIRFMTTARIFHRGSYFLPAGATTPAGILGIVNAVFELKEQIQKGRIPMPVYIICPLGSGGTTAGLALGVALAGMPVTVLGIRVSPARVGPFAVSSLKTIKKLMSDTMKFMHRCSADVPSIDIPPPRIIDDYLGNGYGYDTPRSREVCSLMMDREGVVLESTYTAKAFAAVLDIASAPGNARMPLLYWHTYNSVDLSLEAAEVDCRDLPEKLQWVFKSSGKP